MKTNRPTGKSNDVYGQEMMAFYKNEASAEIIERDDGLIQGGGLGGKRYYFSEYRDWAPMEKEALRYVRGRVLDIGCGAGRHALYLQKKGFDVLGIDNAPLALKVCRLRGLKKTRVLPIEKIRLLRPGSFETILMMGNNFGLFGSFQKTRRLLRSIHRLTSPQARIIAQTLDPHQTRNPLHKTYHRRNLRKGRMAGQVRIRIRFSNLKGPWIDYLFVSRKELAEIVKETGWHIEKTIPPKQPQYMAVLRKA